MYCVHILRVLCNILCSKTLCGQIYDADVVWTLSLSLTVIIITDNEHAMRQWQNRSAKDWNAKNGHFRKFKLQSALNHATCSHSAPDKIHFLRFTAVSYLNLWVCDFYSWKLYAHRVYRSTFIYFKSKPMQTHTDKQTNTSSRRDSIKCSVYHNLHWRFSKGMNFITYFSVFSFSCFSSFEPV